MEMFGMLAYAKGNPGAMTFLMEMMRPENLGFALPIVLKIEEIPTLRGTNLYVLWSDLCGRNIEITSNLCKNCPSKILEDACSRQDYSGRELVKEYMS